MARKRARCSIVAHFNENDDVVGAAQLWRIDAERGRIPGLLFADAQSRSRNSSFVFAVVSLVIAHNLRLQMRFEFESLPEDVIMAAPVQVARGNTTTGVLTNACVCSFFWRQFALRVYETIQRNDWTSFFKLIDSGRFACARAKWR